MTEHVPDKPASGISRREMVKIGVAAGGTVLRRQSAVTAQMKQSVVEPLPALVPHSKTGHQFVLYADSCSGILGGRFAEGLRNVNKIVSRLCPAPEFVAFPGLRTTSGEGICCASQCISPTGAGPKLLPTIGRAWRSVKPSGSTRC